MLTREEIFTDPTQLNALYAMPFVRANELGNLRLGGTIVEHPEKNNWETELNRYFYACGCDAGATVSIIALLLGGGWSAYLYFQGSWGGLVAIVIPFLMAIGGALVGKRMGLIRAREQLRKTVNEIQSHWK